MNAKNYIDTLFLDYQESPALKDFKEELCGYLNEQIANLVKDGIDEKSAFDKATKNLGDMSAVADEISLKKKQEVLSEMYMKTRNYISKKRSAFYALFGLILGIAILFPLITWLASGIKVGAIVTILPFGMASILGLLFMGLTQETATREAMNFKRALWYILSAGLILFGILVAFIAYFGVSEFATVADASKNTALLAAVSAAMMFTLPGITLGIFLVLTEKDNSKPWIIKLRQEAATNAIITKSKQS